MEKIMTADATVAHWIPCSPLKAAKQFESDSGAIKTEDDVLVESARRGDGDSFARLIDRYGAFCFARAYWVLRNRGDAEDEVQNAWMHAWINLGSYQGPGAFRAWISRIVFNQSLMRLRKKKLTPAISIDQVLYAERSYRLDLIDQRDLPEDIVGSDEVARVLTSEMRRVPPVLREVLIRRDVANVAIEEIAGQLGIGVSAAKSRLRRGRLELRRRLTKYHGEQGGGTLTRKMARPQMAPARL
jgi:RNA polymerase sigma-70 factor, ECF subfamily